jgi:hypothetical protein
MRELPIDPGTASAVERTGRTEFPGRYVSSTSQGIRAATEKPRAVSTFPSVVLKTLLDFVPDFLAVDEPRT